VKRDTAIALVLALLAIIAIGLAAATLDNPVSSSGDGFGSGSGDGTGSGESAQERTEAENGSTSPGIPGLEAGEIESAAPCWTWLDTFWPKLALVLAILSIAAIIAYVTKVPVLGVMMVVPLSFFTYLFFLILTSCGVFELNLGGGIGLGQGNPSGNNSSGGGMGEAAETVASQPSLLLGVILVVLVVAAVLLLFLATGNAGEEPDREEETPPDPPTPDIGAVGRAAGEAADRIAGEADAGNEVYRAWAEMTDHLAVDGPESSTPAEFAEAAVDAGMAPDDVRELTSLFEEVRYGTVEATEDREERAVAALRRIEAGYAEGEQ
jgi:hypothetical protein